MSRSNDRFISVASAILPFAFLAKHDGDEQVRDLFDKTWKDNVGGSRAVALYLQEIVPLVSRYLDSPRWGIKHASALTMAELVTSFGSEISVKDAELMWRVLEKALAGKSWAGKEVVLDAFVQFTRKSRGFWEARGEIRDTMKVSGSISNFRENFSSSFSVLPRSQAYGASPRSTFVPLDYHELFGKGFE